MESPLSICFGCGSKENLKKCGDCFNSETALSVPSYCGRECQVKDWAVHKYLCAKNDKVIEEEAWIPQLKLDEKKDCLQWHIITEKDIEPGCIIFQRKALLTFPKSRCEDFDEFVQQNNGLDTSSSKAPLATCLSCYEGIPYGRNTKNKCGECGWPVHSGVEEQLSACEKEHQKECKIIHNSGLKWNIAKKIEGIDSCLGLLRAWLLPEDKKKQLLDMPKPTPEMTSFFLQSKEAKAMKTFMLKTCKIKPTDPKELEDLMLALKGNMMQAPRCHNVYLPRKEAYIIFDKSEDLSEVHLSGRVLTQDCVPNCAITISPDLVGTFRTIRKVFTGETLTISLTNEFTYSTGVLLKTQKLLELLAECNCRRCTTADEDGTFLSAVKVPENPFTGKYYLPQKLANWWKSGDLFQWTCSSPINAKGLPKVVSQSQMENIFGESLGLIYTPLPPRDTFEARMGAVEALDDPVEGPFHAGNSVVITAKLALGEAAMELAYQSHGFDFKIYKDYLPPVEAVVEIMDKLKSGWTNRYGRFLQLKGAFKLAELADEIESQKGTLRIEYVDKRVLAALREFNDGLKIQVITDPLGAKPFEWFMLQTHGLSYGYELIKRIDRNYPRSKMETLQGVKALRKFSGKPFMQEFQKTVKQMNIGGPGTSPFFEGPAAELGYIPTPILI